MTMSIGLFQQLGRLSEDYFITVYKRILSDKSSLMANNVIAWFQEFLLYVDVKYYFLKQLSKIISVVVKGDKVNLVFMENVLSSLEVVSMENLDTTDSSKMSTLPCKDLTTG
jgi:hypothetical protein